jgi:hypothetical protein
MAGRIFLAIFVMVGLVGGYFYYTGGAGLPPQLADRLIGYRSLLGMAVNPASDETISEQATDSAEAANSGENPATSTTQKISDKIASLQSSLPQNTTEQLGTVSERTGQLGGTVGQVLGEAVKVASTSGESSLQERAFDYGRYLYCQQVVKDYEARTTHQ